MERISTILHFALLLLVGTIGAYSDAKCDGMISPNPSTLTFTTTSSPSAAQAYVLTSTFTHQVTVAINPSVHTQVTSATNLPYVAYPTVLTIDIPAGGTQTIYVEVVTDAPISTLNEYVENSWRGDDGATAAYPVQIRGTAPLPIQLASFKALRYGVNSMQFTWSTISEVNNYEFYVQESLDQKNWDNFGELVRGHGTTLEPQQYSVTLPIANGSWWMRLKQIDLDGRFTASEAQLIEISPPVKFVLNQNYPNPFNPSTRISFSIPKEGPVSLRVYDILGREVVTLVNENRKAGQYTERFDGSRLASGVYMYVLQSAEGRLTSRMILAK